MMEDFKLITEEPFLTQKDKFEIIDCLDNLVLGFKRDIRKAVYTVAIRQYVAIISSVWAVLYFLNY